VEQRLLAVVLAFLSASAGPCVAKMAVGERRAIAIVMAGLRGTAGVSLHLKELD
jgi:hypothetical protein